MAQEGGNVPAQQNDDVKADAPSLSDTSKKQKKSSPSVSSREKADAASIDALSSDASGEYVRDGSAVRQRKKSASKKSGDDTSDKKGFSIPILRTYHSDTRNIAETKGGAELRTILAKEAEEKRRAQEEYLTKTKDIMKESAVLRDQYENFSKAQREKVESRSRKKVDREHITRSISGAAEYMKSTRPVQEEEKPQLVEKDLPKVSTPKVNVPAEQPTSVDGDLPDVTGVALPTSSGVQTQKHASTSGKGLFARIRGRVTPEDHFTEQERQSMQEEQKKIVEKESIEGAWKDFQKKKKALREKGLEARDVRSYTTSADISPGGDVRKLHVVTVIIIFVLIAGLVFGVIFLATKKTHTPGLVAIEEFQSVPDVVGSENKISVDMSASPDGWPAITQRGEVQYIVNKFVPYELRNEKKVQISFDEFIRAFIMRIPPGLRDTLGNYYFVGNYVTQSTVNGIFIVSVENYSDALVWMLKWEKNTVNSFVSVFPNVFQRSNPENVSVEHRVIDNKDVRVLKNPLSENALLYYFFNRSILVFVAGDESMVSIINNRIRSANAQ